jgi:hypothetical protein
MPRDAKRQPGLGNSGLLSAHIYGNTVAVVIRGGFKATINL